MLNSFDNPVYAGTGPEFILGAPIYVTNNFPSIFPLIIREISLFLKSSITFGFY